MNGYLLDTHSAIWYLTNCGDLSSTASRVLESAEEEGTPILLATISIVEVIYLVEKQRLPPEALTRLMEALDPLDGGIVAVPLGTEIAARLHEVSRDQVPDMPDRIIAATALQLGVPLVTRDAKIRSLDLPTVW